MFGSSRKELCFLTKAMKITLSVSFVLAAVAMTLFICWHIQGRTAMDDAAARVKQNEDMIFVRDKWSTPFFVKRDIYGDLFGENGDKTLSSARQWQRRLQRTSSRGNSM